MIERKLHSTSLNLEYLHNFIEPTKDKSGMGNLTKPNDYSVKFVKKHKYKAN